MVITRRSATTKCSIVNASHFKTLNPLQQQQVHLYIDALLDWNQKMNLTAVRDANDVMDRHIEDSLAIIPPIRSSYVSNCDTTVEKLNLVDVGSGAGLPGLILAIACPVEPCFWKPGVWLMSTHLARIKNPPSAPSTKREETEEMGDRNGVGSPAST
ncbi:putative 16S rRNA (guanine(527)-N(7))-methyltransferase [Helianthus annuus]|uniref:16S rRNA (Guanine(527)-N(7))-methyltransferase n=1 Tax=Helianthus annuus TaxID=4232 RepID=A0A251T813_HELAN|nr:ribosomal RNA small subunit methyltransferase G [Helianthus annuus]KAF5780908.1 putative 16S rRNA (guanine(527)-N(7))-methyltransferase [Helianthus annuus]KAJ0500605.1 putative 16S rRNA (guanine(527)-N(7))-methyltransferase [Helianthus annuus]KAJ0516485.1 putative 16S rRNA (guanine(527)-N(7))-methyltransferase [Helianthus annuus]KAJ0628991.1 putative 16S rRNA (guanine(527)-N(7))-methyltransferase [Helianthus annuus]KAJ0684488.1 putative 16S rRNA (guanine(527)-N(7))-methyltransferase [Helian